MRDVIPRTPGLGTALSLDTCRILRAAWAPGSSQLARRGGEEEATSQSVLQLGGVEPGRQGKISEADNQ